MFLPLRKAPTLAPGSGEEGELGKAAGATCQNGSRGSIPDTDAVASVKSQSDWATSSTCEQVSRASARSAEFDPRRTYCELAPLITLVFFFMTTDERFRGV